MEDKSINLHWGGRFLILAISNHTYSYPIEIICIEESDEAYKIQFIDSDKKPMWILKITYINIIEELNHE
jgi:hypothetical protein